MKKSAENKKNSEGFLSFLRTTSNLYMLFLRNHFKSSSFYISNLIIPFFIVFSMVSLFPISYSFIWIMYISISFSAWSSYGTLFFNFKNSTANKNLELTKSTTASVYCSTLIMMFIVTLITILVDLFFLFIFVETNWVKDSFPWTKNPDNVSFNIGVMSWSTLVYYWITLTLLSFSMTYVVQEIVVHQKSFFIVMFIFIFSSFFFGGIFSTTIKYESDDFSIMDGNYFETNPNSGLLKPWLAGQPMWWISQFFPVYGLNQISSHMFDLAINHPSSPTPFLWPMNDQILKIFESSDKTIKYYSVITWVWLLFDIWLGTTLQTRKISKEVRGI